jgi:predicted GNAT family acetyltransferase
MTTATPTIERQDYKTRGTYVATVPGVHGIARLNYKRERPDLIVAEHTESSESLRGTGAALALVERMVEDARKEGVKIYALCTYVEQERREHPEWADVFATHS